MPKTRFVKMNIVDKRKNILKIPEKNNYNQKLPIIFQMQKKLKEVGA